MHFRSSAYTKRTCNHASPFFIGRFCRTVGPNVVATGSGSVNLSGLQFNSSFDATNPATIRNISPVVEIGPVTQTPSDDYGTITGPASLGPAPQTITPADSGSGALIGIVGPGIMVPEGYVSGTVLGTSTDTWDNQTFATLGIDPGTYTFTLGSPGADTFTVNIGPVPEPASLSLFALGAAAMLLWRSRTRGMLTVEC
jgi:PEP-CTERM motif